MSAKYLCQLNPPIPLETPKGSALAVACIDYGPEYDLMWVCFTDTSGECWTWANHEVRAVKNTTMGRLKPDLPRGHPKHQPGEPHHAEASSNQRATR